MKRRNLLQRIANNPKSARFDEIVLLLEAFGFKLARKKGSHHIFIHPAVSLPVNIQDVHGDAKPYQVRQFLKIVERFNLKLEEKQ
jgi:predicted RNA binding protein YcfA (HicA-like mRNA interferase family)